MEAVEKIFKVSGQKINVIATLNELFPQRKTHQFTEASVRYPSGGGMHFDSMASRLTSSLVFDVHLCRCRF